MRISILISRFQALIKSSRHFRNEKGTRDEMRPTIVSGIVTGGALISYWPIFPCP